MIRGYRDSDPRNVDPDPGNIDPDPENIDPDPGNIDPDTGNIDPDTGNVIIIVSLSPSKITCVIERHAERNAWRPNPAKQRHVSSIKLLALPGITVQLTELRSSARTCGPVVVSHPSVELELLMSHMECKRLEKIK